METKEILELSRGIAAPRAEDRQARLALGALGLAPIEGAAGEDIYHPLGPPVVSGTTLTVETALNQPTRVTRMLMDLTLQRFIADRIFTSGGGVTGGAVIYDSLTANELYLDRDVERVEPGAEFPEVAGQRLAPNVATVNKWGGKVYVTDEARDRNDSARFTNRVRQLANTIVRKMNAIAISTLDAAITSGSRTVTGRSWSTVVTGGSSQSAANLWPARDFALAGQMAETDELGIDYNLWILNPLDYTNLIIIYGASGLSELLQAMGISIYVSNRVTAGTAYVVAEGQVGQMRIEKPLATETWREANRERTAMQSSVRPVMFVDNSYAVLKFTGIA